MTGSYEPAQPRHRETHLRLAGSGIKEPRRSLGYPYQQDTKEIYLRPVIRITVAAAVLILVLLGISVTGLFTHKIIDNTLASRVCWLPDSSRVKLKAYSSLKYNYRKTDGVRMIRLKGEAFFDVKKGKTFEVQFPGGRLKVLGTRFNIQAYSANSGRIDCYSGSVELTIHDQDFILGRGKSLTFDEKSADGPFNFDMDKKLNLPDNTYCWLNRPLREVLMLICQRENYTLKAPEELLMKRFTGQLNLEKNGQALQILAKAMNFSYQIKDGKLMIIEKN